MEVPAPWNGFVGKPAGSPSASPGPVSQPAPALNGIRLVLVEDHADALEVTRRILERQGAQVATGANGQEGLVALRILRPDAVLTDLAMPVMDGYALIRHIRALGLEGGGGVPVIAVSAHAGPEERQRAQRAGFAAHLAKPFAPGQLIEAILAAIKQAKAAPPPHLRARGGKVG
jgi:CheY-like chemotaxis protein